jgi:hypothetical protein
MLSEARYQGEAEMAATARDTAPNDEARQLYDQAWAAYATAARHARLSLRWANQAAGDKQVAAQAPLPGSGFAPGAATMTGTAFQLRRKAEESAVIAARHVREAEQQADFAAQARLAAQSATGEGPPPTSAPVNVDVPHVQGTGTVGGLLTATMGNWDGEPTVYAYRWQRDQMENVGGASPSYVIVDADAGHSLTCIVTATNAAGSTQAPRSNAVAVEAAAR